MTEAELRAAIYYAAMTLATIANTTSGDDPSIELWLELIEKNFNLQSALRDYLVARRGHT